MSCRIAQRRIALVGSPVGSRKIISASMHNCTAWYIKILKYLAGNGVCPLWCRNTVVSGVKRLKWNYVMLNGHGFL